jgi:hypothetical protein
MSLPHQTIEGENLAISPEDFVVIPELYGHVMEQLKNFPCGKIVLCQAYDYMLETLAPGVTWQQHGFFKCITTSEEQKNYIKDVMKSISIDVINPIIPSVFSKKDKPSKPIISIHTREPRDTAKVIKTFYLKYPQYRWLTFRDMRGIKQEDFAKMRVAGRLAATILDLLYSLIKVFIRYDHFYFSSGVYFRSSAASLNLSINILTTKYVDSVAFLFKFNRFSSDR